MRTVHEQVHAFQSRKKSVGFFGVKWDVFLLAEKIHQAHGAAQKAKKSLQKPKTQKSVSIFDKINQNINTLIIPDLNCDIVNHCLLFSGQSEGHFSEPVYLSIESKS